MADLTDLTRDARGRRILAMLSSSGERAGLGVATLLALLALLVPAAVSSGAKTAPAKLHSQSPASAGI